MKLRYVDVLRGLAILGVLIVHCSLFGNNKYLPPICTSIINNGARGVQLFYIASAFTLFLSMSKRYPNEKHPILFFFIRRFFRIAPMYYIGIFYYLWMQGYGPRFWLGDANEITIGNILSNFFFIHSLNPYWTNSIVPGGWSISIEILFYCLLPLLFLKIKTTRQAFIFVVISLIINYILSTLLNRYQLISCEYLWNEYLFFYLPNQLPIFALGILFYFIVKENYKITITPGLLLITSFILISGLVGLSIIPHHFLFGIAFVVLSLALSKYEFKILVNPVLIHIGKISFSMYLVHVAILFWLEKRGFIDFITVTNSYTSTLNYAIRLLFILIITVIISTILYKLIEVPMQNVGKRLIYKLNN